MPFPISPSDGEIYQNAVGTKFKYVAAENKWQVVGGPTLGGEANVGQNVGTAGTGVYKGKVDSTLQFKKLNAGSTKLSVVDDTGNDKIDLDVVPSNINHSEITDDEVVKHRLINDAGTSTTELWSSSKIDTAKENAFSKNTAFNKNFGSGASDVCEGNDSRLSDARTPTDHGNEAHTPDFEPAFTKNTAFNKNFGVAAGTVSEGNHKHNKVEEAWFIAEGSANYGDYRTRGVGATGTWRFTFNIPANFISMVSCQLIFIPAGTATGGTYTLESDYGAIGESYVQHSEIYNATGLNVTQDVKQAISLTPVLSAAAAGDVVGLFLNHTGVGTTLHYLGIRLKYNAQVG